MSHPLIAYEWMFGLTECLHIIGFALTVGSIALVDLHLAGLGFAGVTTAAVHAETRPWTRTGLVLVAASGLAILSTDAARYLSHPAMLVKLCLFVAGIVFNYTWHARVAAGGWTSHHAKALAAGSLSLWVLVVFGGVFYAFT